MLHINVRRIVAQLYWHTTQRHCGSSTEMLAKLQELMLDNLKINVILLAKNKGIMMLTEMERKNEMPFNTF
jgi:hypothetical protein